MDIKNEISLQVPSIDKTAKNMNDFILFRIRKIRKNTLKTYMNLVNHYENKNLKTFYVIGRCFHTIIELT